MDKETKEKLRKEVRQPAFTKQDLALFWGIAGSIFGIYVFAMILIKATRPGEYWPPLYELAIILVIAAIALLMGLAGFYRFMLYREAEKS